MSKILIVFSSIFGANAALATLAEEVLKKQGADVRVRGVPQLVLEQYEADSAKAFSKATEEDLEWADGYVFTSPVHTASISASMKAFVDGVHDGAVAGKYEDRTFTAMVTADLLHSGQEVVAQQLNGIGEAWGCLIVAPSTASSALNAADGNAFGLSFALNKGRLPDGVGPVLTEHLSRFVRLTTALSGGVSDDVSAGEDGSVPLLVKETEQLGAQRHTIGEALS